MNERPYYLIINADEMQLSVISRSSGALVTEPAAQWCSTRQNQVQIEPLMV